MKYNNEFELIYQNILNNNMEDLEVARKYARNEIIKNVIIVSFFLIFGIIVYIKTEYNITIFRIYLLILIVIYFVYMRYRKESKLSIYKKEFKKRVIKVLVDSFDENVKYFPCKGIDSNVYDNAEFDKYHSYNSEDLIYGKLKNDSNFSMAEVHTYYKTRTRNGEYRYHKLFFGILSVVTTLKPFNAKLYLRQNKNVLNKTFLFRYPLGKLRVELDSYLFEKNFDVYSSDKIIAMQLLTPDIMQLLIDFKKKMKINYELTIKSNRIYIRFMCGKMFENTNVLKFSLDKKTLYKYYKMIDFTLDLSNKLIKLINDTEYGV